MPRDIDRKHLRIVTAVCAFSLSITQVNAEDQFLVDEGKVYAEIIISESPARSTRLLTASGGSFVGVCDRGFLRCVGGTEVAVRAYE